MTGLWRRSWVLIVATGLRSAPVAAQAAPKASIPEATLAAQQEDAVTQKWAPIPELAQPRDRTAAPPIVVTPLLRNESLDFIFDPVDRGLLSLTRKYHLTFRGWYSFFDQNATEVAKGSPRHNQLGGRGEIVGEWKPIRGEASYTSISVLARTENNIGISQKFDLSDQVGSVFGTNSLQGGGPALPIGVYLLYLEESLHHSKLVFDIGKLHTNSFIDLSTMADAEWKQFMSGAYTGNATNPDSGLWSTGAAVQYKFQDNLYLHALVIDDDGQATTGPQTLGNKHDYEGGEIGYKRGVVTQRAIDYRAFYWHKTTGKGQGNGGGLGFDHELQNGWTPFGRWGYGVAKANAVRQFASLGIANVYPFGRRADLVAVSASWGHPSDPTQSSSYVPASAIDKRNEMIMEAYYRVRITKHCEITPDLEVLVHPINQPGIGTTVIPGARLRLLF